MLRPGDKRVGGCSGKSGRFILAVKDGPFRRVKEYIGLEKKVSIIWGSIDFLFWKSILNFVADAETMKEYSS